MRQYYQEGGTHLVLNARYMCEEHEVVLMNRLVESRHQIGPYDRYQIGRVTDRMACPERSSRYYMNMINDLKNYFFYRKHHEHVPGIMLIEVARQAVYAQYYRTSPNKRGEVTLTIRHLNCNFEGYIESNYPVVISVETVTEDDDPALDGQECRVARFFSEWASARFRADCWHAHQDEDLSTSAHR